jgi:isoquinoline 1-oxidoreductase
VSSANKLSANSPFEPERCEFRACRLHRFDFERRDFFKLLGAGMVIFAVSKNVFAAQESGGAHRPSESQMPKAIGSWLHIGEKGEVTAFTGKTEIGQNIRTSLAQSVADELRVPFESVRMVMADTSLTPYDMGTFGSRTTPTMAPQLRHVAAAARDFLVARAAKDWNVAPEKLLAANGRVKDPVSGREVSYAQLASGNALQKDIPPSDPITSAAQWTVAGKPLAKVDARDFVTGRHRYSTDLRPEGLLYGKVLRPPSFGATLTSVDTGAAEAIHGVTIVHDGDFVGAAAPSERVAEQAIEAIHADWKEFPQPSSAELFSYLKKNAIHDDDDRSLEKRGSVAEGLGRAAHRLEVSYNISYIAHAPLEPRAALAEWKDGKLTVWAGTQRPFAVRDDLADAFGVSRDAVRVIVPDTGSAYGGKHTADAALEATRLARAAGRPVSVVWTREEEFTWAYFRPAGVIDIKSGVASDGTLLAWEFHNFNSGGSGIATPYTVPNQWIEFHPVRAPLRQGSYRGLAATANHFARESHMDDLAHAVSMDPLEFRLKNLSDERLGDVFKAAAKSFGWPAKKVQPGQGFGLGGGIEKGGYVATFAEVRVDRASGSVKVERLVTAFDCGAVVNPDGLRNQIVGANVMALGGALSEAIEFDNGKISNPRFSRYRVPRFRDVPKIEAVILDRKDIASAGAGETPIMAVAPAIGNAIFDATGLRLTTMPMVPRGLKI